MKRKTNLFYLSGDDSNFLTFSNYTESLTGNFLATDYKLYPSKFICMYIPSLDSDTYTIINDEGKEPELLKQKELFIKKYLVSKYENKLSFLRDYFTKSNDNIEEHIFALGYLLEAILSYDENSVITYIDDVTEQDFNGIYADTLCIINGNGTSKYEFKTNVNSTIDDSAINYTENTEYLYGWTNILEDKVEYIGPKEYTNYAPTFDAVEPIYYWQSKYTAITESTKDKEDIKFNVIIPLFNVTNMNPTTNTQEIDEEKGIELNNSEISSLIDVPLGIWFSTDTVVLKRDTNSGYIPNWSLMLSSQFKPFPYSKPENMPNEISGNAYKEFDTYSQVLARQNQVLDKFNELTISISNLSNEISIIKNQLANIATTYEITNLKQEMITFENKVTNLVNNLSNSTTGKDLIWHEAKL